MKKILLLFLLVSLLKLNAQYEISSFSNTGHAGATTFATDYQATGINPANLGWDWKFSSKKFVMGFSEFTGSMYSEALSKTELRTVIKDMISNGGKSFTFDQKRDAAKDFTLKGFTINADLGTFGASFITKHAGGFAFRMNDHFQWYNKLGSSAADLLFMGRASQIFDSLVIVTNVGGIPDTSTIANNPNLSPDSLNLVISGYTNAPQLISKIMNGSEITLTWTREYNLSYGRRIFGDSAFALFGGIGIKYFQGLALINVKSVDNKLEGYSSLSPAFDIDYGTAAAQANQIAQSGVMPKPVGAGFGFDFGLNAIIASKLKLGVALINAGSIKWKGNLYRVKDTLMYSTSNIGLQSYDLFSQLKDIFGEKGLIELRGEKDTVIKLPGVFRTGGSILLGKRAELGFDCIFPLTDVPGKYNKPVIGFGGDIMPTKWLKLQAGFLTGGNYDFQIPVGFMIIAKEGTYEMGIASRDAITFFTQNGPTISLSTGFLRFRF